MKYRRYPQRDAIKNYFPLPNEVFQLGLETGELAVKERLLQRNPTDGCVAPRVRKVEMRVLSPEEIGSYLDAAERRNALPMYHPIPW